MFKENLQTKLQNLQTIETNSKEQKLYFAGISIGSAASTETGIAILDRDLNLLRIDKAYNLSDLKLNVANIGPMDSIILCVDLPKNIMLMNGKWRIESKNTQVLSLGNINTKKSLWRIRFSDRGSELCKHFISEGMEVYRYNCYFTKNMLKLEPPYKTRTPAGCKFLQQIIEEKLGIKGIPSNLIPLPTLNAIIGAYIGYKTATSQENDGYKTIGIHKNVPIISAL